MKKVLFITAFLVVAIAVGAVVVNARSADTQVTSAQAAGETGAIDAIPAASAIEAAANESASNEIVAVASTDTKDAALTADVLAAGGGNSNGGNGAGSGGSGLSLQDASALPAAGDLSPAEADALLFMIEEEKLACDVYNALYAVWGVSTFQNIAASEQGHMDSLAVLLERYGLTSPVQSAAGVFTNPELQALYTQLVARGSTSLSEALKVGGAIEEIDILDLQSRLALTDNADIQQVFNNLLRGSENHLRSFANALLKQTGETYVPQYLTPEAYAAIMAGTAGSYGNGRGGQGGGGRGGRGGQP
jgi:hypothetical protein